MYISTSHELRDFVSDLRGVSVIGIDTKSQKRDAGCHRVDRALAFMERQAQTGQALTDGILPGPQLALIIGEQQKVE